MKRPPVTFCYACEQPATSVEHAPPKCFFPDRRDLPEGMPEQRSHLITVPACVEHNQAKSGDDEYAACCIAMNVEGSALAMAIFEGTKLRAMKRNEASLGRRIFSTAKPATNREGQETLAIRYEVARIHRVIEQTARALYFHETGMRWSSGCTILCPRLFRDTGGHEETFAQLEHLSRGFEELRRRQHEVGAVRGAHPDVFWYQLSPRPEAPLMRMMFYTTFEFFATGAH